jgi:prepilin-type N-terminal cleavage/methylation domain-containing protein
MLRNRNSGFTLIELLVVISIISLLSSVVAASVATARDKAKAQKAMIDMMTFANIVSFAQGESGKTLSKISTDGGASISFNSAGVSGCGSPNILRNVPVSNACYIEWTKVIAGVKLNAGTLGDKLDGMNRDPWGSPYLVDQNQGEGGNCASKDIILSVGPDGVRGGIDDITATTYMPLAPNCP